MQYSLLVASLLFLLVSAERLTFDLSNPHKASLTIGGERVVDSSSSIARQAQSGGTDEPCYTVNGDTLVCEYAFAAGQKSNETMIYFTAQCDFSAATLFDYRQASNCACNARVVPKYGPSKECPCTVCAAGFGETPVSVDCSQYEGNFTNATIAEVRQGGDDLDSVALPSDTVSNLTTNISNVVDPYLFGTCTSIDCSGACNGTCAINCDASGDICPYCENYAGEGAPTSAPVGNGDGSLKNFGESASHSGYGMARAMFLATASVTLFFL